MKIGIVNNNAQQNKKFPTVVEQAPAIEGGMYKAIFNRFVTFGFHPDDFNEGQVKFYTHFGFELIEDMMGNKVPAHWRKFDDGTEREDPKTVTREYALMDEMHHKSNGFMIAKALNPNVEVHVRGKDNEHQYIIDFPWNEHMGTTVLLQVQKVKAKAGHFYNKIQQVMPLGVPLEQETENCFFNLYDSTLEEVWEKQVFGWEKAKIQDRVQIPGEPEVVYGDKKEAAPAPAIPNIPEADLDVPF